MTGHDDYLITPFTAADSRAALGLGVSHLSHSRRLGDSTEEMLVVLGTLAAEIESELSRHIGTARRDGLSFTAIEALSGISPARARRLIAAAQAQAEEFARSVESARRAAGRPAPGPAA